MLGDFHIFVVLEASNKTERKEKSQNNQIQLIEIQTSFLRLKSSLLLLDAT